MRDFETIRRSILRRSGLFEGRSSWPLISGDTYRSLCELKFDTLADIESIQKLDNFDGRVYISAGLASRFLKNVQESAGLNLSGVVLLIHNGDHIPSLETFLSCHRRFKHIYCVNWLHNISNISPLPIGLENMSYMRNGVPRDFQKPQKFKKDIELLVSFSDHTNPAERLNARQEAMILGSAAFVPPNATPKLYRDLVSRSKFVISPPGNGPDCHRTWEAIYLGAIPIVKRNFWPFHNVLLPVAVVDRWDQMSEIVTTSGYFQSKSVSELNELFLQDFADVV
jgi:hypothetical protein